MRGLKRYIFALRTNNVRYCLLTRTCLITICLNLTAVTTNATGGENRMTKQIISACPDTPNCVSSLETGTSHFIEPLNYQGSMENARKRLLDVINAFKRTQVLENTDDYIRVTFTSFLFRFTDDVEFQFDDDAKLIHMKSSSRVGYSDLGANRRRCEAIRERFKH